MPIAAEGGCGPDTGPMPLFYMNDYSLLGLCVPDLTAALEALRQDGFKIEEDARPVKVHFDAQRNMTAIFDTLNRHRISYRMSDLVNCAYQG